MRNVVLQESGGFLIDGSLGVSRIVGAVRSARDGTIVAANDAFLKMTGSTREELEAGALRWQALFGNGERHDGEPWQADVSTTDGHEAAVMVEIVAADPNGWTAFAIDVSATRLAEAALVRTREVLEARNRELYGATDDVTAIAEQLTRSESALASATRDVDHTAAELDRERQRVEALAARLASINRELDAFSYSVSHDLRTPLRSIDGFSRVLLTSYAPLLDERGRDYLQRVRSAAQRMSQLLDDLLKLARTSRASFAPVSVDLTAAAQQIAAELRQLDPQRRVEWNIEPGLTVQGDRTLLRVALENLLANSWKFTSRRETSVIELGARDEEGTRVFFVRDNGAGFDMTYADQLFGVFQRLHTNSEFEGTGVGLATVQRVIHRHGGEVWAESAVDKGATFYFTLGQKRPAARSSETGNIHDSENPDR
jgi:signal transduction histidine kinase